MSQVSILYFLNLIIFDISFDEQILKEFKKSDNITACNIATFFISHNSILY